MSNNGRDTKDTRHISRRINFVINGEKWNLQKTVWCEGGLQLLGIDAKNVRKDALNFGLKYTMVILDNWHTTFTRGAIGNRRFWRTIYSNDLNRFTWYELNSISLKCLEKH